MVSRVRRTPPYLTWRTLLLGAALGVLIVVAVAAFTSLKSYRENEGWVRHTYQVLASTEQLLANLNAAETAQRGILLGGGSPYRERYDSAVTHIAPQMNHLREL